MSEINESRVTSQSIRCDSEKVLCVSVADEFMPASVFVNGVKFKPESDEPEILPAQIGEFVIDPLESAISNIVREAQDAQGLTLTVLQDGLVRLLKIQREKLGGPAGPDLDECEGALAKLGLTRVME